MIKYWLEHKPTVIIQQHTQLHTQKAAPILRDKQHFECNKVVMYFEYIAI